MPSRPPSAMCLVLCVGRRSAPPRAHFLQLIAHASQTLNHAKFMSKPKQATRLPGASVTDGLIMKQPGLAIVSLCQVRSLISCLSNLIFHPEQHTSFPWVKFADVIIVV